MMTSKRGTSYVEYFIVATAMALATVVLLKELQKQSLEEEPGGEESCSAPKQIAGQCE